MPLASRKRCSQKPSSPASWITTTLTARPSRRSAVSRSFPSSVSSPGPSPAVTPRFEIRSSPGELVATSQDLRLSSSATNTVLSSGRVAVATGWAKSVQDIGLLHECDWATAFYQIGCRPHRHGICLTDFPCRLLKAAKRRLGCGQTRTVRNTRLMGDAIRATCGMGYYQTPVHRLLYFHRPYARDGERLFLPGAYRLPLAISPDRLRCAPDGPHLV